MFPRFWCSAAWEAAEHQDAGSTTGRGGLTGPAGPVVIPRGAPSSPPMEQETEQRLVQVATDEMRVPFWVVLAGVGVGAFWALMGVLVGTRVARRR